MDKQRAAIGEISPESYKAVFHLEHVVNQFTDAAGIDKGFGHLLRLRASQINKCAYCVRLHTQDAVNAGESTDRISVIPAWRETTEYFTEKERASLALIEAITLIADGQIPDDVYEEAARVLDEKEIAAVEWIGVAINAWNRIAISSRSLVKP